MTSRSISFTLLTTFAAFAALVVLGWAAAGVARNPDRASCRASCQEQEDRCLDFCSRHANPVECEAECRDDAQRCMENCD